MNQVIRHIDDLTGFLEPFLKLANCHMVDFFTKSAFGLVPSEVRKEISHIGQETAVQCILANKFDSNSKYLKAYIEKAERFSLKNNEICLNAEQFYEILQQFGSKNIEKFKLQVFVSPKKSHEVEILSGIVAAISQISQTSHLVDIGDGKGYLSSVLALHHKIPVLGIDASSVNTKSAIDRAAKLTKAWKIIAKEPQKSKPNKQEENTNNDGLYKQITQFIEENCDFSHIINGIFPENPSKIGLIGLHTCGNLAPTSLKLFNNNTFIKSICNVSCCYHLLSEKYENNGTGFPLSHHLSNRKYVIGRKARMITAQSVDRILDKQELPNLSIFYRALLQVLLEEHCHKLPTKTVGKFRKPCNDFVDYTRKALKRIQVDIDLSDEKINDLFLKYENRISELNLFYLIRSKLAPVIESLILLDRLLFLLEQGYANTFLVQLFDPVISPRCYGIVALKNEL